MEHIVNLPMPWEFKAIVDFPQDLLDPKWSKAFVPELVRRVSGTEIPSFQPNTIPFLILVIVCLSPQELLRCQDGFVRLLPCLEELLLSPLELGELTGSRGLMRTGNRPHP